MDSIEDRFFDKDGNPLELLEWAKLFEDVDYKRVGHDDVISGLHHFWVSTVWLGFDHNLFGTKPHLYETMVFENKEVHAKFEDFSYRFMPSLDDFTRRYSTLAEAQAGHKLVVKELEATLEFLKVHHA